VGRYLQLADAAVQSAQIETRAPPQAGKREAPLVLVQRPTNESPTLASAPAFDDERGSVIGDRPSCDECGRADWTVSIVLLDGGRTCADCASGLTVLRRRGVPI
jgi:hypothetical protein